MLWTLPAALFACLAYVVMEGQTAALDLAVRGGVHARASPWLTTTMKAVTVLGTITPLLLFSALLAWLLGPPKRAALKLLVAALGGEGLDQVMKAIFQRPRPEVYFGLVQPQTYGFPSGHAMASCCFYGMAAVLLAERAGSRARRVAIWTATALLVGAIGFSRVYLGVHNPTDVIGGYLAGSAWLLLAQMIKIN